MPSTDTPDALVRSLSDDLRLNYEPQDWGIANADGARLSEFVSYFRRVALEPTQRFELAELILASANEALSSGKHVSIEEIIELTRDFESSFAHHIEYWLALADDDEFPISAMLRNAQRG